MPYDAGYEEAGWRNDLSEARWALIPVPFGAAALAAVIAVYRNHRQLGWGELRAGPVLDGHTAYGGLATLMTVVLSLGGIATALIVARTSTHRVRRLAVAGATCSAIVFAVFVGFAVATA